MEKRLITNNMISEEKMSNNEESLSKEEECNHYRELMACKRKIQGVDSLAVQLKESRQENVKLHKNNKSLQAAVNNLQRRLSKNGLSARQRYKVLMAMNDRCQMELMACKRKIQGVDTLAVLLKESKQENVTLHKNNKTLQAAVNNLQRRLSKNGLSASPSLQDTELFIPGASKQTIDKLAKENMRLRKEKKSTDELEEMKVVNEKLESENNLLKQDVETYKEKVAELSKKRDEEKELTQQNHMQNGATTNEQDSRQETVMMVPVGCQASDLKDDTVSELSELLKLTVRHCSRLDEQLQQSTSQISEGDKFRDSNLKTPVLVDEDYQKLKTQLNEAQIMNQRWHDYCQMQNKNIHTLNVNMSSLNATINLMKKEHEDNMNAAAHQEETRMKAALASKDSEIQEVKKQAIGLSRENQDLRGQVELYTQQIRVCTEDFNTERKDREQAVNKAKTLQDANLKLREELERLKLLNNAELMNRLQQPGQVNQQTVPHRQYRFVQERGPSGQILPGNQLGYNTTQPPLPVREQTISRAPSLSPHIPSDYNNIRLSNPFPECGPPQGRSNFEAQSLLRLISDDPNLCRVDVASTENYSWKNNLSMPILGGRPGSGQEQIFACPKCRKEFSENSSADLLNHIDKCIESLDERPGSSQEQLLACPKCRREFPENRSADLLNHINKCIEYLGERPCSSKEQLLACPKCRKEFPENCSADLLTHIDMCHV